MCGRITQKSNPKVLGLKIATLVEPLYADNTPPRYNGSPGQEHWVIRQHTDTGERTLDRLWWGLIPYWMQGRNAAAASPSTPSRRRVATLPTFRDAYKRRRCLLPIDNFFEWKAIEGEQGQAALRHRHAQRRAVRAGRHLGELEATRHGGVVRTFCVVTYHGQRADGRHPRPHAGDHAAGVLRPLALARSIPILAVCSCPIRPRR